MYMNRRCRRYFVSAWPVLCRDQKQVSCSRRSSTTSRQIRSPNCGVGMRMEGGETRVGCCRQRIPASPLIRLAASPSGRWQQPSEPFTRRRRAPRQGQIDNLLMRTKLLTPQGRSRRQTALYQSLCLPAGVPSDQLVTATKNTRIGGNPFIWDCSFGVKNQ